MLKSDSTSLISIGIPFYNAQQYLGYAIESVLSQTYENWELILVDDGSSDNSLAIANMYAKEDSRIRVISDGLNKKLPARLNQLIDESKYKYIARMDADDIMHPERLEKQLSFLEVNKRYDLVSTGLVSIDNCNRVQGYRKVDHLYDRFSILKTSYPVVHPSVMARRSWFERNKYSEKYPRAEDFELWTRAISNKDFKMAVLPDLLLYYREEGNLSVDKILNTYSDVFKIYSSYHPYGKFNLNAIKKNLKILIVKGLHYSGNLQMLARRRNSHFQSDREKAELQAELNEIVINIKYT